MKKVLFLFFILWLPYALLAELPPSAYIDYKKNAPEILTLTIENITTSTYASNKTDVSIVARILTVYHSKSNVKNNDLICINYKITHRDRKGWVGPSALPILKKKQSYKAFLKQKKQSSTYLPAAGGKSFILLYPKDII